MITSDKYMGPLDGDEKLNFMVTRGFSAYQTIQTFYPTTPVPGIPNATYTLG